MGIGRRFKKPKFKLMAPTQNSASFMPDSDPCCITRTIPTGPLSHLGLRYPEKRATKVLQVSTKTYLYMTKIENSFNPS